MGFRHHIFKKSEEGVKALERVETVISKAEKYGANPDMVEDIYRNMISRFINIELEEYRTALEK